MKNSQINFYTTEEIKSQKGQGFLVIFFPQILFFSIFLIFSLAAFIAFNSSAKCETQFKIPKIDIPQTEGFLDKNFTETLRSREMAQESLDHCLQNKPLALHRDLFVFGFFSFLLNFIFSWIFLTLFKKQDKNTRLGKATLVAMVLAVASMLLSAVGWLIALLGAAILVAIILGTDIVGALLFIFSTTIFNLLLLWSVASGLKF